MRNFVFSIFDRKAEFFDRPFVAPSRGAGIRAFGDAVVDPKGHMAAHAEDYDLYVLGEFHSDRGKLMSQDAELVARGADFIPAK